MRVTWWTATTQLVLATIGSALLPFLAMVGLYLVGVDVSGPLYWLLVGALSLTAVTIWAESFYDPLAKAPDFAIGMTLAVVAAADVRLPRAARPAVVTAALGALVVLVMTRPVDTLLANWWHPLYAGSIALALSAIVLHEAPYPSWMSWKPLVWIGGLGYGIYLIHEPGMRAMGHLGLLPDASGGPTFVLTALLVTVPTVALAWVSSRTVEAAGLKALGMVDRSGAPRDYYGHTREPLYRP